MLLMQRLVITTQGSKLRQYSQHRSNIGSQNINHQLVTFIRKVKRWLEITVFCKLKCYMDVLNSLLLTQWYMVLNKLCQVTFSTWNLYTQYTCIKIIWLYMNTIKVVDMHVWLQYPTRVWYFITEYFTEWHIWLGVLFMLNNPCYIER